MPGNTASKSPSKKSWTRKFWETRYFGLVLGFLVFAFLVWVAFFSGAKLFERWDHSITDVYFRFRTLVLPQKKAENLVEVTRNEQIHPDILLLGIDNKALDRIGRWPFPRSVHADFLNTFSRVQNQNLRERSVFFDIFFIDRERQIENDVALAKAIDESGRVFLETIYDAAEMDPDQAEIQFQRQKSIWDRLGRIGNVKGEWENLVSNETIYAPLIPIAQSIAGNGHAAFYPDEDKVFRRQNLVSKVTQVVAEYPLDQLKPDTSDYAARFQRYVWTKRDGTKVTIPSPLSQEVIQALLPKLTSEGVPRQVSQEGSDQVIDVFFVQKVQDTFLPSITLALALDYWNKKVSDIQVELGQSIRIPNPQRFDPEEGKWKPYTIPGSDKVLTEVVIPIDSQAAMAINFMGPRSSDNSEEYQTFPERSYSSYISKAPSPNPETWVESREVANKILMTGPFSSGVADDEKNTPYGLMFGVEIHANALNTILMNRFLVPLPNYQTILILFVLVMLVAFLTSRMPTFLSLAITFVLFVATLISLMLIFDAYSLVIPFSVLGTGTVLSFLLVIVYRALTEEKDKQKIRSMFGKYVSPDVVSQIIENPPELGGVDKELTVLFSDIRGFTTLSEGMTPQELVNHLNLYLTAMTDVIHQYYGTLDKYVGDEIMCFWGAPLEQKEHALLASKCALKMMEVLHKLNDGWPESRKINIGIGLNSGIMTVGNMGSQGRMNYTLMGDNVNLAARLEGTNKEYMTNVIISENTYSYIKETAIVRELDNIRVKGKNKPVLIYELLDFTDGLEPPLPKKS